MSVWRRVLVHVMAIPTDLCGSAVLKKLLSPGSRADRCDDTLSVPFLWEIGYTY
jgi:hypothetical protein